MVTFPLCITRIDTPVSYAPLVECRMRFIVIFFGMG